MSAASMLCYFFVRATKLGSIGGRALRQVIKEEAPPSPTPLPDYLPRTEQLWSKGD
eukprot:c27400_g1_i5 orf=694-861(+)